MDRHIDRLMFSGSRRSLAGRWFAVGLLVATASSPALAQREKEIPEPRDVELTTKDGVRLAATYFGSDREREAGALILLHMFKGSRADYEGLARLLQREHHFAVLTLDLRGHGESIHQSFGEEQRTLSPERLRHEDFEAMVQYDVEEAKRFLIRENNSGQLNIERLGLVGAEMGATIAAYWTFNDWAAPRLTVKQGQDVKALVLISPETRFKAFSIVEPFTSPEMRSEVALYLIAGAGSSRATKGVDQIQSAVKRYHPEPAAGLPADKALAEKTLFVDTGYATSLQGTKMLGEQLGVEERIARFFELRLVKPSIPWAERRSAVP
ncbi:MAG: alpha/beta fold hydrolase [Planctomycetaceae bacterium]|nr:alpha/beta fold hydrolase [Planctomycetaceae bacterium]